MSDVLLLADVMQREVITLLPEDFVTRVDDLFKQNSFHHLPVVDKEGKIVGIVSSTDLDRISYGQSLFKFNDKHAYDEALYRSLLVQDIMSTRIFQMSSSATIESAYRHFSKGQFRAIPVVDGGALVGIVTPLDLVGAFINRKET